MRIVGGYLKGRKFHPPAGKWPTRPTTDFAKEAIFNIFNNNFDFEEIKVLELFGGTGNHSFEFVSRGCQDVTYVDKFHPAADFVQKTAKDWNIEAFIRIVRSEAFQFLERETMAYDIIFADPPYAMPKLDTLPNLIFQKKLLKEDGWLVLEHNKHYDFRNHPNFLEERNYGNTLFSIFEN